MARIRQQKRQKNNTYEQRFRKSQENLKLFQVEFIPNHINIPKVTSEVRNDVKTRREKATREGHARKLPKEKETRLIQTDEIHGQKEESVGKVVVHEVETRVYEKSKNVIFYFVQFF